MIEKKTSIRGNLIREMIGDITATSLGEPIQKGKFRKHPIEPPWKCPSGYHHDIIQKETFTMEYIKPIDKFAGRVILQLHGGGYIGPMKNAYRRFAIRYSELMMGGDVLTIDYRVAPEYPYPAALEDAVTAYIWLLEERGLESRQIVLAGDSAGGGLTFALTLYLRDHNMPLPAGIIVMSPWMDLTNSGESYETNFEIDPLFGNSKENMLFHSSYIGEQDPREPYISPIFGTYQGFPPILIQVGTHEVLFSDSVATEKKAKEAKVRVKLSIYEGMFHVFQMAGDIIPESKKAWKEIGKFLDKIFIIET